MSKQRSLISAWEARRGWFKPGIGVKRWLIILALGAIIAGTGIGALFIVLGQRNELPANLYRLITLQFLPTNFRILVPFLVGGVLIMWSVIRLGSNLLAPFRQPGIGVAESLHLHSQRSKGPRVVAIGGGTGMPSLLRGLKNYTSNITAIVTVADDGGSSGRLRRELGVLPPGDFRNNIAALARDEELMTQLLQYRFGGRLDDNGDMRGELQGHAFGNLLLAALNGITGSFEEALVAAGRVLAVRGRVLPSTLANVTLVAKVAQTANAETSRIVGESAIPKALGRVESIALDPPNVSAYPPAVQAILQADLVVIGPGSLYTSIIPNLLVPDISRALQSTRARRVYVCNLATQPGETDNYTVADHVKAILRVVAQSGLEDRGYIDVVLANSNLSVPPVAGGGYTVYVQPVGLDNMPMVTVDLVDENRPWRHDSEKLAAAVMSMV